MAEEIRNGQCSWGFIKYIVCQTQRNHSRNGRENYYRPIEGAKNMPINMFPKWTFFSAFTGEYKLSEQRTAQDFVFAELSSVLK